MTRSISIIIPAFNEEGRLPGTLERVLAYLQGSQWEFAEIVVVDDGSTDGTVAVAEGFPQVRVLRNPGNRGKGYSVRQGMLQAKGAWALFTDADLSTPIEDLEKLWAAAEGAGAPIAIGSRAVDRSLVGVHQSIFREASGRLFNVVMRVVLRLPLGDTQCGFKLFEAGAAREIFGRQKIERFGFDAEVLFVARLLGYKVVEAPVRWNNVEGTKVSLLGGAEPFLDLFRIRGNQIRGEYRTG